MSAQCNTHRKRGGYRLGKSTIRPREGSEVPAIIVASERKGLFAQPKEPPEKIRTAARLGTGKHGANLRHFPPPLPPERLQKCVCKIDPRHVRALCGTQMVQKEWAWPGNTGHLRIKMGLKIHGLTPFIMSGGVSCDPI